MTVKFTVKLAIKSKIDLTFELIEKFTEKQTIKSKINLTVKSTAKLANIVNMLI